MTRLLAHLLLFEALAGCDGSGDTEELSALRSEVTALRAELRDLRSAKPTEVAPSEVQKTEGRVLLEVLKVKGGLLGAAKQTEVAFQVKNESALFVDTVLARVDAYGAGEEYLGNCNEAFMNVSAGKVVVDSCTVLDVPLKQIHRVQVQISIPTNDERIKALSLVAAEWRR